MRTTLTIFLTLLLVGCGNSTIDPPPDPPGIVAVHVAPQDATLTVRDGAPAEQPYTAMVEYEDGTVEDVTESAVFSLAEARLGTFQGANLVASGVAGGRTTVTALIEGGSGQASLTINVARAEVIEPAPVDAAALFEAATEDPARAPSLVYPSDQTLVPPNLGDFDVHWLDAFGNDLFEVRLTSEFIDLRTYVTGAPGAGSWVAVPPELWRIAASSERTSALSVSVRGLQVGAPEMAGTSDAIAVEVAEESVEGGIYYWASRSTDGPGGIYRHDMGSIATAAEQFYTTDESQGNRCVACHALSRDGTRMALTFDGGNGEATVLDVGTRATILPIGAGIAWNFATFEPQNNRLLAVSRGALELRDLDADGAVVATVPTAGYATHPDFHPLGTAIVYVQTPAPSQDWIFSGGTIVTQSFDPVSATFGEPTVLVEGQGNNFYPAWSPDGAWIMFNRSSEDSYDDASAELFVVKADGTVPPVRVDSPNVGSGLTNSWARWAPFEQQYAGSETYYWFTFSSKRDFGVRLVSANRPQVWMAPFFPDRALAGEDASAPAFRLPAQDLTGSNHIAQWTESVVPIE